MPGNFTTNCRICDQQITQNLLDLGYAPPSNAYIQNLSELHQEIYYPLSVNYCSRCHFAQTSYVVDPGQLFSDNYAYVSSASDSWVEHCKAFFDSTIKNLKLGNTSKVLELASNDGYLLDFYHQHGCDAIGVEPTQSTRSISQAKGHNVIGEFFGEQLAKEIKKNKGCFDLIIANNVLAHVPDLHDFTAGIAALMDEKSIFNAEFPTLNNLVSNNEFDTIYHEHYSYLSLQAIDKLLRYHGLKLFKVDKLKTHGGSYRIHAVKDTSRVAQDVSVKETLHLEGRYSHRCLQKFKTKTIKTKNEALKFLLTENLNGKKIAGYGAAAKGNTFLNYIGADANLISFIADKSPFKQGKFTPGSHIPITPPSMITTEKPDYLLILPWNLAGEIASQLFYTSEWDCKLIRLSPEFEVVDFAK